MATLGNLSFITLNKIISSQNFYVRFNSTTWIQWYFLFSNGIEIYIIEKMMVFNILDAFKSKSILLIFL